MWVSPCYFKKEIQGLSQTAAVLSTYDICFDLKTEITRTETHFKFLAVHLTVPISCDLAEVPTR